MTRILNLFVSKLNSPTHFQSLNKDVEILSKNGAILSKYIPPTRSQYMGSLSRYKDHLKFLDTSIFSRDSEKVLKTLDVPSREDIIRGREADRIRHSAEMQVITNILSIAELMNVMHSHVFFSASLRT